MLQVSPEAQDFALPWQNVEGVPIASAVRFSACGLR